MKALIISVDDFEDLEMLAVDGNLVTSRQPGDLPAFMRETMKMIKEGKP